MKDYWKTLTFFKKIKFSITIFLFVLVIIFSFQNWEKEKLDLIFISIDIHLTLIIAFSMLIGFTISMVSNHKKMQIKEVQIKRLKEKIKELTVEKDI
jgi:uncharacterized integral membrane protein